MEKLTLDIPLILPDLPDLKDKCLDRLIDSLERKDGVERAHIKMNSDDAPVVCIHFDPDTVPLSRIKEIAKRAGAKLQDTFGHVAVDVSGIRHARKARRLTEDLNNLRGVVDAYASASGRVRIEFKRDTTSRNELLGKLSEMGFYLKNDKEKSPSKVSEHEKTEKDYGHEHEHSGIFGEKTELIFSLTSGVLLVAGFGLSFADAFPDLASFGLFVGAYFFGGFYLIQEAFNEVKAGNFEIDFLMLVAAAGAAILGQWAEGALLLFLFSLGHSLEHYAMGRARDAIKGLGELAPKTALRKTDAGTEDVNVENLETGDVIVIKPNSKIPADGVVVNGKSSVNQAPITGESVPVDKTEFGDMLKIDQKTDSIEDKYRVFAGTINGHGSLEVKVTKLSKDSTLSRLIMMVNEAETQKSPTQQFTDKFEKYFVPAVLILVASLHFTFLVVDETFAESFYRVMAVLVAASPCALAISTPSAVLSGVARAARGGVLIKGGLPLENLGDLKTLAFDKTGTLTEGKPNVTDVIPFGDADEAELLTAAVAVERLSDHPLGAAVTRDGTQKLNNKEIPRAVDLESITGKGVKASLNNNSEYVGSLKLFEVI